MLNSVNQIRVELEEIANAHLQINDFFWGDFLRAYKENTELNYVLMGCFYPTASLLNNQTQLTLTIYIADRVYKDYSNLNDVESDTLQICRDVYNVINSSFRWKRIGRVQSASAQKFIERGGDEVAGHTLTIQFLVRDVSGICELPMQEYDFDEPAPVPGECDPAELQILDSNGGELYNLTLLSGTQSTQEISDSTALLKNTADLILSTTSILAEGSADIIAPDAQLHIKAEDDGTIANVTIPSGVSDEYIVNNNDISVNGVFEFDIHATHALDIRLRDESNNVLTPVSITDSGNHATIVLPNTPDQRSTATLMKTGQTTSYRTGDDGDIEAGRATDFLTLDAIPLHDNGSATLNTTTSRFTDELGGQTYADNIVLDWSTWNGSALLGFRRTFNGASTTWDIAVDDALAVSIGSFTSGWRLPNVNELSSLMLQSSLTSVFNYSPFNSTSNLNIWSGTTSAMTTVNARLLASTGNGNISTFPKTVNAPQYFPVRIFSLSTSNVLS